MKIVFPIITRKVPAPFCLEKEDYQKAILGLNYDCRWDILSPEEKRTRIKENYGLSNSTTQRSS